MINNKALSPLIKISKLGEDRIGVSIPYYPEYIQKIKTVSGHLVCNKECSSKEKF